MKTQDVLTLNYFMQDLCYQDTPLFISFASGGCRTFSFASPEDMITSDEGLVVEWGDNLLAIKYEDIRKIVYKGSSITVELVNGLIEIMKPEE